MPRPKADPVERAFFAWRELDNAQRVELEAMIVGYKAAINHIDPQPKPVRVRKTKAEANQEVTQ